MMSWDVISLRSQVTVYIVEIYNLSLDTWIAAKYLETWQFGRRRFAA